MIRNYIVALHNLPKKLFLLLFFVLCIFLSVTFLGWAITQDVVDKEHKERFLQDSNRIQRWVQNRFDVYIIFVSGIQGFFEGTDEISQSEWSRYINRTHILHRYPGIYSINFAEKVTSSSTTSSQLQPEDSDEIQESYVIKLIEPVEGREQLIGFNLLSDSIRSDAIHQARDTGKIVSSSKMSSLISGRPAFSLVAPVYKKNQYPTTLEERQSEIRGVAYVSFVEDDVFNSIFGSSDLYPELDFEIYDNTSDLTAKRLLFDSDPTDAYSNKTTYKHIHIDTIRINGDEWGLVVMGKNNFRLKPSQELLPLIVLTTGILFSFYSFFFFLHMLVKKTKKNTYSSKNE